jgi:hypothetical protein
MTDPFDPSPDPDLRVRKPGPKAMLLAALVFRPSVDFMVLGTRDDAQVLMDLSRDEGELFEQLLATFGPVLDQISERDLRELLWARLHLLHENAGRMTWD